MSKKEKFAYRKRIKMRYDRGSKEEKSQILEEFCKVCDYNRKYAIRLLNGPFVWDTRKPGRASKYQEARFLEVLKQLWFDTDRLCSKKLKKVIPGWLKFYDKEHGTIPVDVREKLLAISPATIDRVLKKIKVKYGKGRSGTKPGTLLRTQIPIRTDFWDATIPGYLEADTVAHCGMSLAGDFVWSLTVTDIFSGWTECRAVWNKGAFGVIEQIKDIEQNLHFPVLAFDSDNGSEFLNTHLVRYFCERKKVVPFTRSRPYHKNDNAHVEQKNWSQVRQLLGYTRLYNPESLNFINQLYKNVWSTYQNHFVPTFKLSEKYKIKSKYFKSFEELKTPYQRLIESSHITTAKKHELIKFHEALNPYTLKREKERLIKHIFALNSDALVRRFRC